jgi:hypothetical protein
LVEKVKGRQHPVCDKQPSTPGGVHRRLTPWRRISRNGSVRTASRV